MSTSPVVAQLNKPQDLPSAEKVMGDWIAALGGEENIKSIKTFKMVFSERIVENNKNEDRPLWFSSVTIDGRKWRYFLSRKKKVTTFDGKHLLEQVGDQRIREPRWGSNTAPYALFRPTIALTYRKFVDRMQVVDVVEIKGRPSYKIKIKRRRGDQENSARLTDELFFDTETKLLTKTRKNLLTEYYSDYRKIDDLMFPFVLRTEFESPNGKRGTHKQKSKIGVKLIKINEPVKLDLLKNSSPEKNAKNSLPRNR